MNENMHEVRIVEFKIVTNISIQDVLSFYKALGRFPTNEEISIMKGYSIEDTIRCLVLKQTKNQQNT